MRISAKMIAYLAMITAVSVIANVLTWPVSAIGGAIAFTYIPNFLAGYYFGPAAGFLVGVVADVLGCIIWPKGAWMPLITLASGLMGLIPGLVRYIPIHKRWHILISYLLTFVICSAGINTFAIWYAFIAGKKTFWVYLLSKLPVSAPNMVANLVINFMLMPVFDRIIAPRARAARDDLRQKARRPVAAAHTNGATVNLEGADASAKQPFDQKQEID